VTSRLAILLAVALLACSPGLDERIERARALAGEGRFEELLPELTALHYELPQDPEVNHLYGLALLRTENSGMAVWPLRVAANTPGREVEDGLLLAQALARGSISMDAVAAIDRVLEFEPELFEAWAMRARVNNSMKHHEEMLGDCERLLAIDAARTDAFLCRVGALSALERFEDAEQTLAEGRERLTSRGPVHPRLEWRLCSVSAELAHDSGDSEEAARRWESCLESSPTALELIESALRFFDGFDAERGTQLLEHAVSLEPRRFDLISALAARLEGLRRDAESERILRRATELEETSRPAWLALAEHYRQRDRFEEAIAATEAALAQNPSLHTLLLAQYADDLIQAGEFERADDVILQLPDHPMVPLLRGRSYFEQGDVAAALEEFEAGLVLWPSNTTARYLAGQAAERLGDIDRALAEYRNALRSDPAHTRAGLELARIHEAEREYSAALIALRHRVDAVPDEPDAHLATLRIARRTGRLGAAETALQALSELPDQQVTVAVESAALSRVQQGPRAAADSLLESELELTDPRHAEALAALTRYLAADGAADEALRHVERALAARPGQAAFHEIHGTALVAASGPAEAARAAFERALELEPERATALAALARLVAAGGDIAAAVALYDRARASDPEVSAHAWGAIELLARSQDGEDGARAAEVDERLLALLELDAIHPAAARLRAERLLERGEDLEEAAQLARRAARFGGGRPAAIVQARVAAARGNSAAAIEILKRLEALGPRSGSGWYTLGRAYEEAGAVARARSAFEQALEAGDFDEAPEAQQALSRLEEADA